MYRYFHCYYVDFRQLNNMKVALILAWAITLLLIILLIGPDKLLSRYENMSPEDIRVFILSFGVLSVLIYLTGHAIRPFFFIPISTFTIAGGYLFGFWHGLLLSMIGATISAVVSFYVSRYLFRDYVKQRLRGKFALIDRDIANKSPFIIVLLRVIPIIPYDVVGYLAGASSVKFKDYLPGTIIGELPGAIALTMLGSSLTDIGSFKFFLSVVLVLIIAALPEIYKRYRRTKHRGI